MTVSYEGDRYTVLREVDEFGFKTVDLVGPPRRLFESFSVKPLVEIGVDRRRVAFQPTLGDWLTRSETLGVAQTNAALAKVSAAFLVAEDPHRRLDVAKAAPLMHQASLVQHVLNDENLRRVLIADEVGLGKTIEAGLIVKRLITDRPSTRVLYLAPARLVKNVAREFRDKLDINARLWIAGTAADARLEEDQVVIASLQKAVFGDNFDTVLDSGPWDVLIVDECHHLSDWAAEGGSANQGYQLVKKLVAKLPSDGRLILLSGTPHQGSEARFVGLLRLLADDGKTVAQARGRVIFRTKEKVRDWHGAPLFPKREVHQPVVVQLGAQYEEWYSGIALLYSRPSSGAGSTRAAAWAKGQALQWAASSIQAGLGFLVRLSIRRLGWKPTNKALSSGLTSLRPYRGGSATEPIDQLYARLIKQIGPDASAELEDIEESEEAQWRPDPTLLEQLIFRACDLLKSDVAKVKWDQLAKILDTAGDEKVVLFAQPVETVAAVAAYIKQRYGIQPALIYGNQSDDERNSQVASFVSDIGPRFLVSSRAGGEGLNMQAARRIIHLDIPWNPMDMEQRIGRVHRFGSRRTILVDTVVAAGSREVDMYRVAREKLALVASQLGPDEFDSLFGRVMALVPPEELEDILGASPPGPISDDASQRIGALVTEGFRAWQSFEDTFKQQSDAISALNPGQATWEDFTAFLVKFCGAKEGEQVKLTRFRHAGNEVEAVDHHETALVIDGGTYYCGEGTALPPEAGGRAVARLGINSASINERLREAFEKTAQASVAVLRRESVQSELFDSGVGPMLHAVFVQQVIGRERGYTVEQEILLRVASLRPDGSYSLVDQTKSAALIRAALGATRAKELKPEFDTSGYVAASQACEASLRTIDELDIERVRRKPVWPVALLVWI